MAKQKVNNEQLPIQEAWKTPSLLSGWLDYGSGYGNPGYYKDSLGNVHIRGLIKSGTVTGGTPIFRLPVGYRPMNAYIFTCPKNGSDFYEIRINIDGYVVVGDRAASATWSSISVTFRAEQ